MISVYNECVICDCNETEILRPQHFVVVYEFTSIHDDILSTSTVSTATSGLHDAGAAQTRVLCNEATLPLMCACG